MLDAPASSRPLMKREIMGHPKPDSIEDRQTAESIHSALSRVREAGSLNTTFKNRPRGKSLIEHARSLPAQGDIFALEVLLMDARTARDELEKKLKGIPESIKSDSNPLSEKAEAYREEQSATFEAFLDAQDVVTSIREDWNLLKDIVDGAPKRRPTSRK